MRNACRPRLASLRTGRAPFRRIRLKQETTHVSQHAVNPIGLEGHLHGTRTEPAPEWPRWWQPHQQAPLRPRRHLCCAAQRRLAVLSRASPPEGSLPACPGDDVAGWLNPYPAHYRSAFACSLVLYPLPCQVVLRLPFRWGWAPEGNGLTTFRGCNLRWFRPRLYAGGAASACAEFGAAHPDHLPFWSKPLSIFGLASRTTLTALHLG